MNTTDPDPSPASSQSKSLLKRLAGPSSGKAGQNEKKKDKELTQRIEKLLQDREVALKEADLGALRYLLEWAHIEVSYITAKVDSSVSHLLAELESQRDLSQIIVHVDMDAFFANVELLHNPDLKGKAFGVGKGVLTTASYEARKFGVRSGMAAFVAKKLCPELILLSIHPERYSTMSKEVMAIFRRYDDQMLAASCDEGYLNITAYCNEHGITADECVSEMRKCVQEETKLTVSAGIAPNKMLAKICSDKNKPNGQYHLAFDSHTIKEFMMNLPVRKVPGIGRVNERMLESIGVVTCGDIYTHRITIALLDNEFGLRFMLQTHLGITSNVVQPYSREERRSIGAERTFHALGDKNKLLQKLEEVAEELENDMIETGWVGRTVTLKYKLDNYQVFTRAKSFERWITKKADLFAAGKELLLPELPLKIRLIGLRVTKLKDMRAPTDSGIKRARRHELSIGSSDQSSPQKRRKLETDQDDEHAWVEESTPAFDEMDERDTQAFPEGPIRPSPVGEKKRSVQEQICPVCGHVLEADDNQKRRDPESARPPFIGHESESAGKCMELVSGPEEQTKE
ncbi:hypothetical protein D9757_004259 [Collybiopsis confluens]|uniref:DNA polymerase kappa n=1 Tax=Collybiopsis confluens TaxID=2823264 RepID=A0A8H5HUC6_9AGAR|nr:hypothetical protein D9757_004259 [Collybiopsis confluens]